MKMVEERNPYIELYNILSELIFEITDINTNRANRPNIKARQWIFPMYPEARDEDFPRVALKWTSETSTPYGADFFIEQQKTDGNVVKDIKGVRMNIPIEIVVFVKKGQKHDCVMFDGSIRKMQDTAQCDYVKFNIKKKILTCLNRLVIKHFSLNSDINVSTSYEDNDYLFAARITFDIVTPDIWEINYTDGDIIKKINVTNVNIEN